MTDAELNNIKKAWKSKAFFSLVIAFSFGFVPAALLIAYKLSAVYTPAPPEISHSELVTVLLAGLTVSIGVLAVVVAGLAIWGYHAIKDESQKIAISSARESAIETVRSPEVEHRLREEAKTLIADEFAKWKESVDFAAAQPPQQAATIGVGEIVEKVGKPRPKKKGG